MQQSHLTGPLAAPQCGQLRTSLHFFSSSLNFASRACRSTLVLQHQTNGIGCGS